MGTIFRQVADCAIPACSGVPCQHCGRNDVPVLDYSGSIVEPKLAADIQLAIEEPEVYEACAGCIKGGNLRKSEVRKRTVMSTTRKFAARPEQALEEYDRLPDLPLFLQHDDWPMCCGEWCEFTGIPGSDEESKLVPSQHSYWEGGPALWRSEIGLLPESLREVSLFRCVSCSRTWFTWQFT